jgi:mevalonate kinase
MSAQDSGASNGGESPSKRSKTDGADVHKGYGKLILFGEHFVVYKVPALVAAVSDYTDCTVEITEGSGVTTIDDRPAVPGYKVEKKDEADEATKLVLKHLGVDIEKQAVKVHFGGNLCAVSGIGASAASCVALARAVGQALGKNLTEEEVNAAGYEGEKGYHGTPSGIDNTAATYGGILRFQRTDADPVFETKKLPKGVEIVYASTGITASTTKVVADVRQKKEDNPEWFDKLMEKYKEIAGKGEKALDEGDWDTLAALLNENHKLCQELTVSCKELDSLVEAARAAGAAGAKMSGTGRGGLMLALTPGKELQDKVAEALEKAGAANVWKTRLA